MKIDISGLPKEKILMELYNNSHTIAGCEMTPEGMSIDHAKRLIEKHNMLYFEWLNGRALKFDLNYNVVDFTEYDSERKYEHEKLGLKKGRTAKEIIQSLKI